MREALAEVLEQMAIVKKVYPSDANFLLVQMENARRVYEYLLTKGIVVRDRSKVLLCDDCLRITIGTEQENTRLVDAMANYMNRNE
jgi:histidinol-phosphate aminotransferase